MYVLSMLFDGDVHTRLEWGLAAFTVFGGAAMAAVGWVLLDIIGRSRRSRSTLRRTAIRVGQHDEEIVEKLRDGQKFPVLDPNGEDTD